MSELCNHRRPDFHFEGETCMYGRDLRTGDKLPVLKGSAQAVVREVEPADEDGWMSGLLDVSRDGPTLISSDTVLSVRRPEPETHPRPHPDPTADQDDGPVTTATVELTVTEMVTYEFQSEVEIPAEVVNDEDELLRYLNENEELWLDDLDPTGKSSALYITERTLDEVSLTKTGGQS
ncbi:hypothetical protein [Streptomyces sp. NPDC007205]|uniref:hypothetical protein n=1 Tax=Streptomyces sp. NPDC007205 TaxID=3154316 RepID=UPI0033C1CD41